MCEALALTCSVPVMKWKKRYCNFHVRFQTLIFTCDYDRTLLILNRFYFCILVWTHKLNIYIQSHYLRSCYPIKAVWNQLWRVLHLVNNKFQNDINCFDCVGDASCSAAYRGLTDCGVAVGLSNRLRETLSINIDWSNILVCNMMLSIPSMHSIKQGLDTKYG